VHVSGALLLESHDGQLYDAQLKAASQHRGTARQTASLAAFGALGLGSQYGTASTNAGALGDAAAACTCQPPGGAVVEDAMNPDDRHADAGHQGYCDDGDDHVASDFAADHDFPLESGMQDALAAAAPCVQQVNAALSGENDETMEDAGQEQQCDAEQPPWLAEPQPSAAEEISDTLAAVEGQGPTAGDCDTSAEAAVIHVQQRRNRQGKVAGVTAGEYYDPYLPLDPADMGTLPIKPLRVSAPLHHTDGHLVMLVAVSSGSKQTPPSTMQSMRDACKNNRVLLCTLICCTFNNWCHGRYASPGAKLSLN
jgi:hypothetical protein